MQRSILDFMVKGSARNVAQSSEATYDRGDLVLAKLPTFPCWPAIVIEDPDEHKFSKSESANTMLHVVFIDDQPSRSWVELGKVEKYTSKAGAQCMPKATNAKNNASLKRAIERADQLVSSSATDRVLLAERELHAITTKQNVKVDTKLDVTTSSADRDTVSTPKVRKIQENSPAPASTKRPLMDDDSPEIKAPKRRRVIVFDDENSNSCEVIAEATKSDDSKRDPSTAPAEKKPASIFLDMLSQSKNNNTNKYAESSNRYDSGCKKSSSVMDENDAEAGLNGSFKLNNSLNRSSASLNDSFKSPAPTSSSKKVGKAVYAHHEFAFLRPEEVKDAMGRRRGDPDYDPTTLYVPPRFLERESATMRQWWSEKCRHFDTILCFKVGKFYEMYHSDAETAVRECGLTMMRGGAAGCKNSQLQVAHCGFPEIGFARHSETLVSRGYRVARVEQTETPKLAAERRGDKCVNRELCAIVSPGVRPFNHFIASADEMVEPAGASHNYLLVLTESANSPLESTQIRIGCCFLDCSIGTINLAEFDDDKYRTCLRTLLARIDPVEVLYERRAVSRESLALIDRCANIKRKESLLTDSSNSQNRSASSTPKANSKASSPDQCANFPSTARATLRTLRDRYAYNVDSLPQGLRPAVDEEAMRKSGSELVPKREFELTLRCVGALVSHLANCMFDFEVLSLRKFQIFTEFNHALLTQQSVSASEDLKVAFDYAAPRDSVMMLDSVAVANLELFANSEDGSRRGTLIGELDRCMTPFGKRLLVDWLAVPLCSDVQLMRMRCAAIEVLRTGFSSDQRTRLDKQLAKLPDLDRLVTRLHTWSVRAGSSKRVSNALSRYAASSGAQNVFNDSSVDSGDQLPSHFDRPDSRASFFGAETYNKRKVEQFARCLLGLHGVRHIFSELRAAYDERLADVDVNKAEWASSLRQFDNDVICYFLRLLSRTESEGGLFPDSFEKLLSQFDAIDLEHARRNGVIKAPRGTDVQADRAAQLIDAIANDADQYLDEQRARLNCSDLNYFGTGRNRYQIEVPDSVVNARRLPNEFSQSSQRRGYRRYTTPRTRELVELLGEAEDYLDSVQKEATQRAFAAFTKYHDAWRAATHCIAVLDCLLSLAKFADALAARGFDVCVPQIIVNENDYQAAQIGDSTCRADVPCLLLTDSRHPTVPLELPVANDVDLRSHAQPITILTGPNMGGKTTLIRQIGLCVVLAQMGAHVPARACKLTPVDRIFTRVGAHDRLVAGESTFMNELLETRTILRDATRHSLVLLDELGRGTSTYDGLSIAYAAICDLFERVRSRTLFSTHFHQLVHQLEEQLGEKESAGDRRIRIGRMSYLLQSSDEDAGDRLTLLFKFEDGACPTSFGLNVAKLAQLPDDVIEYAAAKSRYLTEQETILNALWKFQKLRL